MRLGDLRRCCMFIFVLLSVAVARIPGTWSTVAAEAERSL
jgi:hypothetical protein